MQLPSPCLLCRRWVFSGLCGACRATAPELAVWPRCTSCGLRVPSGLSACSECERLQPLQAHTFVAVDYRYPWDRLVQELKFGGRPEVARPLAHLMAVRLAQAQRDSAVDLVLPVPLAPSRLSQRGYNQAWELARHVAAALRRPALGGVLERTVDLPEQAGADRRSRMERLRGVFSVPARQRPALAGRRLALVDDVYTTGATAHEAVVSLMAAGAASVEVWALARTPAPVDSAS